MTSPMLMPARALGDPRSVRISLGNSDILAIGWNVKRLWAEESGFWLEQLVKAAWRVIRPESRISQGRVPRISTVYF
jgi:hypothetical protein